MEHNLNPSNYVHTVRIQTFGWGELTMFPSISHLFLRLSGVKVYRQTA